MAFSDSPLILLLALAAEAAIGYPDRPLHADRASRHLDRVADQASRPRPQPGRMDLRPPTRSWNFGAPDPSDHHRSGGLGSAEPASAARHDRRCGSGDPRQQPSRPAQPSRACGGRVEGLAGGRDRGRTQGRVDDRRTQSAEPRRGGRVARRHRKPRGKLFRRRRRARLLARARRTCPAPCSTRPPTPPTA